MTLVSGFLPAGDPLYRTLVAVWFDFVSSIDPCIGPLYWTGWLSCSRGTLVLTLVSVGQVGLVPVQFPRDPCIGPFLWSGWGPDPRPGSRLLDRTVDSMQVCNITARYMNILTLCNFTFISSHLDYM